MASLVLSPKSDTDQMAYYLRFADKIVCDVVVAQWLQEGSCSFYDYCTTLNSIVLANYSNQDVFDCKIYTDDPAYYVGVLMVSRSLERHQVKAVPLPDFEYNFDYLQATSPKVIGGEVCSHPNPLRRGVEFRAETCYLTSAAAMNTWCINGC
eukprot:CAMPEP_0201474774 /NCGR_PEP_ID=MMETSP0151_2-20130828/216_1 /ASSEMBLY_ACC=CAM_ASM_000257 /TAXON_ID=200890 /ORGANISM="Paramoeba atlantica, Strain 621/1 / CCAP 1560/9" /LENGTH=151 /DNA_ID=CAMNT_0047854675 /DNA_START=138 /DNA_END=593 /DNA_ORIENTATION=-